VKTKKVAVIGAGITGLSAAYYLRKRGFDVSIFDKNDRPGGVIQTTHEGDFLCEMGPSTGTLSNPEAAELIEEMKDVCEIDIADDAAKYRWILKKGKWHAIPDSLLGGIKTPLFTWSDKIRLLGEPFRKPGKDPNETLGNMVRRRMGESFLRYAVDPFILGIYSGDPDKLVTKYAMPKLYRLEQDYGSFIGGAAKKIKEPRTERDKKATKQIFSIKGGLSKLINALYIKTGTECFNFNVKDLRICLSGSQYKVCSEDKEPELFDEVISTVGGYALRDIFPFLSSEKLSVIEKMQYSKVILVSVGFKKWTGVNLKAFGGLIPFIENRRVLGGLFLSSFLKDRAPKDGALIATYLGGIRHPEMTDMSDEDIRDIVEKELTSLFGIKNWNPDMLVINRQNHAIPQYGIESQEKIEAINMLEMQWPGLTLAGNIQGGIGMADRIKQGRMVADKLAIEKL